VSISTWCSDADNDALTFTRTAPEPQHGTATAANGVITYTPAAGYTGPDSFGYIANDGHGGTTTSTFSVNVVTPPAPTCDAPDAISVRPGRVALAVPRLFRRLRRPLTIEITDQPDLGTLTPSGNGTSQFRTYKAGHDGGRRLVLLPRHERQRDQQHRRPGRARRRRREQRAELLHELGLPRDRAGRPRAHARPVVLRRRRRHDQLHEAVRARPRHPQRRGWHARLHAGRGYTGPDQFNYKATDGHTASPRRPRTTSRS
jgi:hypothetical protein